MRYVSLLALLAVSGLFAADSRSSMTIGVQPIDVVSVHGFSLVNGRAESELRWTTNGSARMVMIRASLPPGSTIVAEVFSVSQVGQESTPAPAVVVSSEWQRLISVAHSFGGCRVRYTVPNKGDGLIEVSYMLVDSVGRSLSGCSHQLSGGSHMGSVTFVTITAH